MRPLISTSRFIILIPILGSFLIALALLVFGGIECARFLVRLFSSAVLAGEGAKTMAVNAITIIDLFLLSSIFYIISLGLYELFIDDQIPLPAWLEIHTLDDLKAKLIGVLVVILGVFFLEKAISWDGSNNLLYLGIAIALMILALTYFVSRTYSPKSKET